MWLSAVSAFQVGIAFVSQTGQLRPTEQKVWEGIEPSVVRVTTNGRPTNMAVCIGSQGLFMAYTPGTQSAMQARLTDGRGITLVPVSVDGFSKLGLYQASPWLPEFAKPIKVSAAEPAEGTGLLAAMTTGIAKVMVSSSNVFGVFEKGRRALPLYDIRFEGDSQQVAGALLFNYNGELLSVACAVLKSNAVGKGLPTSSFAQSQSHQAVPVGQSNMGPIAQTVAYSPALGAIRRVVDGFLAPTHRVVYPTIGLFCVNDAQGGAQIQSLVSGGPAFLAGIALGDTIVSMNGTTIKDQVGFAKVMFALKVGERLRLEIRRGPQIISKEVIVGKQTY